MSDDSFERIPPGLASVSDAGSPPPPRRDVELVVKLGGAAITHKDSAVASLNEPALRSVAETIAVAIEDPVAHVRSFGAAIPRAKPSLLLDFEARRPGEIDYINGAIPREAAKLGGEAPVNATLTRLVRFKERGF